MRIIGRRPRIKQSFGLQAVNQSSMKNLKSSSGSSNKDADTNVANEAPV